MAFSLILGQTRIFSENPLVFFPVSKFPSLYKISHKTNEKITRKTGYRSTDVRMNGQVSIHRTFPDTDPKTGTDLSTELLQ